MTGTFSTTDSFTLTHAKHLSAKVAADLTLMQYFYGLPSDASIDAYVDELNVLLKEKMLDWVKYGFHANNGWVVYVGYTARDDFIGLVNDDSGRVPPGKNVAGASWLSMLQFNAQWFGLSSAERSQIEARLPFHRNEGTEPSERQGVWRADRTYSKGGQGLDRGIYS